MTEKDNTAGAALLTRARDIKRGRMGFVVVAKETFQAMEGLAWLASDPERYNAVVSRRGSRILNIHGIQTGGRS